jgi:hypothetical protein
MLGINLLNVTMENLRRSFGSLAWVCCHSMVKIMPVKITGFQFDSFIAGAKKDMAPDSTFTMSSGSGVLWIWCAMDRKPVGR